MTAAASAPLGRRATAEGVGTAALVAIVVGSGIQATELSRDVGVQLLANSLATVFGLGVLIALLGPISGAHFNPVVSLASWWNGRRDGDGDGNGDGEGDGLTMREAGVYALAQTLGAIVGAVVADGMFAKPLVHFSGHDRSAPHLWLGELVATAGLVALVFGLGRTGRDRVAPMAVASWIGAAYWFTSSTSFANPAVTVARAFSDTFAGIAPASVPGFLLAQFAGAAVGLGLVAALFGRPAGVPVAAGIPGDSDAEPELTAAL